MFSVIKGGLDESSPYNNYEFNKLNPYKQLQGGLDESSPYNRGGLDKSSPYNLFLLFLMVGLYL
jgi:hypothetical protein